MESLQEIQMAPGESSQIDRKYLLVILMCYTFFV